jgi:hypothetical protein
VADEFEGRTEWVSRSKLQCPWPVAGEWFAARAAWSVASGKEHPPDAESEAVDGIMGLLVPRAVARREHLSRRRGLVTVVRPDLLAKLACVPVEQVLLSGWWHDQVCTVPWATTLSLCEELVRANESRVLPWLRELEQASVLSRQDGAWTNQRGRDFIAPGTFGENYDAFERETFELLRRWLGSEVTSREDELAAVRAELDRVTVVVQTAVSALREQGLEEQAWDLQKGLRPQMTRKEWRVANKP